MNADSSRDRQGAERHDEGMQTAELYDVDFAE